MKWNELFGSDYYIEIKNDERKYFALDEISSEWERSESFSNTNIYYKRTVVFWENTTIKKVIVEEYIRTCPDYYFDRIERIRNEKHKTVKYQVGDIFRVEKDRFHYCYGLITGKVHDILKWGVLPERHSMHAIILKWEGEMMLCLNF